MNNATRNPSRFDAQIARKDFTNQNIGALWEDLWVAILQTVHKLNTHYSAQLTAIQNDHGTLIQVGALPDTRTQTKRSMEINLRRGERKIVARVTKDPEMKIWDDPVSYAIKANVEEGQLFFESETIPRTAGDLAEHLLAERMLELDLGAV